MTCTVSPLNAAYMVGSCCYVLQNVKCSFLQVVSRTVQSSEVQNLTLILRCLCSYVMNLVSWYSGVVSNVFLTYSFESGFMMFECPSSCCITCDTHTQGISITAAPFHFENFLLNTTRPGF